jgi:hypothetical protein
VALLTALYMALALVLSAPARAQSDSASDALEEARQVCSNTGNQAVANFVNQASDPSVLDRDNDGICCEERLCSVPAASGGPTASASARTTASPTVSPTASASPLPETGGPASVMALVPLALLVGGGLLALRIVRRS